MTPGLPSSEDLAQMSSQCQALAEVFKLPLQHRIWRGQAGEFQGAGVGNSLDFQDHRSYVPGDDPRHINWQAYARTGHYSMKLYREEVRPLVDLVFDVSDSMFFDPEKRDRSLELFYFSVHSAWKSSASLKVSLVRGGHVRSLSDDALRSHDWARIADEMPDTDAAAVPQIEAVPLRAQSMRILLSDLLHTASPERILAAFVRGNGRAIVLAPFLESERDPDWEGNYEFIEAESRERFPHRVDRTLLKRYRDAYRRHFSLWSGQCRRYDILMARIPAGIELRRALQYEAIERGALEIWS